MRSSRRVILGVLLAGTIGIAVGVEDPRETADPSRWLEKAMQAGLTEIELGTQAQSKASSAEVKAFGARMIKDHRQVNDDLAVIARRMKLPLPASLDPEHRAMVEEVTAKRGTEFDALYSQHMVSDHAKAIDLFTQATQGTDRELAAFARKVLPILKAHKALADQLAARAGSPVTSSSSNEKS
jgi:putative membrane protein